MEAGISADSLSFFLTFWLNLAIAFLHTKANPLLQLIRAWKQMPPDELAWSATTALVETPQLLVAAAKQKICICDKM